MNTRREALAVFAAALFAAASPAVHAKGKHHHKNGKALAADKLKSNGNHVIDKSGPHTISIDAKDGKIAGMKVKHDKKGDVAVRKYKTGKKLVMFRLPRHPREGFMKVQQTYMGTTYIGYAYYDDYGDEQIYWYPYDMILDGDTGAVEYVPAI